MSDAGTYALKARIEICKRRAAAYTREANDLLPHVRKYTDYAAALLKEATELQAEVDRREAGYFTSYRLYTEPEMRPAHE